MSTIPHSLEAVHFSPQTIYCGDCLEILRAFPAGEVDLIYIDPPFNSSRNYEVFWGDTQEKRAFDDRFGDAMAYIEYMRPRVDELYRVLKPTGSFYYHCDWHASHYIKVMLDEIFGANQFRAELIWKRTSAHANVVNNYGMVHDTIFFYTKGTRWTWNQLYAPYSKEYLEMFFDQVDAAGRRYARRDLTASMSRASSGQLYEWKGIRPIESRCWAMTKEKMDELDAQGKIHWPKNPKGMPRLKFYSDEAPGIPLQGIWDDISVLHNLSKERLGYPTQKPLALLERIIKASSNPGDVVLDAFCGCGTTLVAAQQLGRRWVGIDVSPSAVNVMGQRLVDICGMKQAPPTMSPSEVAASEPLGQDSVPVQDGQQQTSAPAEPQTQQGGHGVPPHRTAFFRYSNLPRSPEQLRALPGFEFENWAVLQLGEVLKQQDGGIIARVNRSKVGDMGIDGRIYLADKVSLPKRGGELPLDAQMGGSGEKQKYLPIQVKNTDKVGRPEIDKFAHALRRDGRVGGFFIGWEFTRDAEREIERVEREDGLTIVPVRVESLIAEDFKSLLVALLR